MLTGVVVFMCFVFSAAMIFFGYLIGVKYATEKIVDSYVNAMFDCDIDSATIKRVIDKAKEYLGKKLKK